MAVFQPRAERLDLSFPVTFASDDGTVSGSCLNISLSGLAARFAQPPEVWVKGQLLMQTGRETVTLEARVARVMDHEAAFAFLPKTDAERQSVRDLVAFAAAHTKLTGGPPPF